MAFISLPAAKSAFPSAVCFPGVCSDSGGKGYGRTVPVWGWVCLDTSEGNHCWQAEGRAHHVRAGALSQVMLLLSPWWEIYLTQRLLKEEWARQANMKFCSPPLRKTVFSFVQPVLQMWPALITNSCLMSGICWPLNGQPSCGGWLQGRRAEVCAFSCRWKWYVHI